MKNKAYYSLFLLYFAVLAFILYLNGVFIGESTSYSNLLINLAILFVIGVLFIISTAHFARLNKCTDNLKQVTNEIYAASEAQNGANLWNIYQEKENLFGIAPLDEAYSRYQKRLKGYTTRHGLSQTCDLEEYINEDLLDQISASHFNSNIAGTLTGLGILGTFFGLSLGLGSFSGNDIFTISDNVGPLLDGMKVAFHTSVYGIFFSLVFTFLYRGIMAYSYQVLEDFLACHRECVMPPASCSDNENTKAMLIYQANMANSMKSMLEVLKGTSAEQSMCLERIVENFSKQLSDRMSTDFSKLGAALNKACDAHSAYAKNYELMEKTTEDLLEANRVMQMTLEQTLKQQEIFGKELKRQQEKIEETCTLIRDDVSTQLYTFEQMRDSYEK